MLSSTNRELPDYFCSMYYEAIKGRAERRRISIPEIALECLDELAYYGKTDETLLVLRAAQAFTPGAIFTGGLRGAARLNEGLRIQTGEIIDTAIQSGSDEYVEPIQQAFTFLTGEEF